MSRSSLVEGFDYRIQKVRHLTRQQWREEAAPIIKAGGFRRIEQGETFVHAKGAQMQFEVYTNLGKLEGVAS